MNEQPPFDVNFLVPSVTTDTELISLHAGDPAGDATISFVQMRPPKNGKAQADVVASVYFPTVDKLKQFISSVQERVKEYEEREP